MSSSINSRNLCVVTNGDSYPGYIFSYRILCAMKKREDRFANECKLRVLCRDKESHRMRLLKEMGAEVVKVDYRDENKLREMMKDAAHVCLIPEHSRECVEEAQCVIKAAKHQGVEYISMHSVVGCDRTSEHSSGEEQKYCHLAQYHQIEKMVKEQFGNNHCIVRICLFNQMFYFMAPQIEGEGILALPVKEDAKWGCIDLNDWVNAIYNLALKEHEKRERTIGSTGKKQLYQFTPQRVMSSKEIAREIGEGLGSQELRYKRISDDEMRQYLQKMKDDERFREEPKHEKEPKWDQDGPWSYPIGRYLNDHLIELMLEYWRMANDGKQEIHTNDLKEVLEIEPRSVKDYFHKNRNQFREFK
ncbi:hypothetical protein RMATCC62417_06380 [Rhizopus microsporus]|nr:hypothetical protein RMATCC62417_06380 [Rhizopus microsporus]